MLILEHDAKRQAAADLTIEKVLNQLANPRPRTKVEAYFPQVALTISADFPAPRWRRL
jgi:hypothetical protein